MIDREELNQFRSRSGRDRPEPVENEADHLYVCKACAQAVDKRRLGDLFCHEEARHALIPADG